ncbi:hypothetical protein Hamer_G000059 [Homarus americanus]|uniref:Uncharacterized protein n=1 Tax=Homarus americanus TaxID=6706 RepID=A0A8J5TT44_HOMAM|nr:hypothetical protein Hamer_G000059 [Homarus americanus]
MSEMRNVNVWRGSGGKDGHREGQQGKPQAKRDYLDRIVEAWRKINVATVLHNWEPLFANSEVSRAEQIEASGERQSVAALLMDTVEAAWSVPAPGFSDLQALITQYPCKAQPVINALASIHLGDDDGTIDDDIEVLGDLLVEDFDGFDAEVREV